MLSETTLRYRLQPYDVCRVPALNSREDREGEVDSDFEIDEPVQAAAAQQRKAEQKDPS